jgi:hypothetical protein
VASVAILKYEGPCKVAYVASLKFKSPCKVAYVAFLNFEDPCKVACAVASTGLRVVNREGSRQVCASDT